MSNKRIFILIAIVAFLALGAGTTHISAQDTPAKPAPESSEPGHAYRLDFTVNEIDDGKKINSRQYSMNLNAGDQSEIKIGSRVPVELKTGEIQYMDVGTNIWCRMRDRKDVAWLGNDVLLNVRSDISNFAVSDQTGQAMRPIVRQMKIDASTIAVVGKPIVVGVVDDPSSKRQFQLELTVQKLR
jgi:hypothetical protein